MPSDSSLIHFRDPNRASDEGVVAVSSALTTANLIRAYRMGIFPWPINDVLVPWFSPEQRAIIDFNDLHVSRRLARIKRQTDFRFTIDQAFSDVIKLCATVDRKEQPGTWITRRMVAAYCALHVAGHAHSVEVWEAETLVGGIYGVDADGVFCGESMFSIKSNASKLALLFLIEHLAKQGLDWLDVQVLSPHLETLGAKEIDREEFLQRLADTQKRHLTLFQSVGAPLRGRPFFS